MATLIKGQSFGATEQVTNTKLHNLVDLATITDIINADIKSDAAISDLKLDTITRSNKVGGTALFNLASIPSGAGFVPAANISFPNEYNNFAIHTLASINSIHMGISVNEIIDDDTMATASATNIASAESVKAYVDNNTVSIAKYLSGTIPETDNSADEKTINNAAYVEAWALSPVVREGVIKLYVNSASSGGTANYKIYINGSYSTGVSGSFTTAFTTADITVESGDVLSLWVANGTANSTTTQYMNLLCANPVVPVGEAS